MEDKGTFRESASQSSDFLVAFDTYMVLLLKPGATPVLGQHFHLAQRTGAEHHSAISKASVTDRNRSDCSCWLPATARSQARLQSPIKAASNTRFPVPSHLQCLGHAVFFYFFFPTPKLSFPSGICPLRIQNTNAGGLCSQLLGTRLQRSSWVY